MKIELEQQEVVLIVNLMSVSDPFGFYTGKLQKKIVDQTKEQEVKDEVRLEQK